MPTSRPALLLAILLLALIAKGLYQHLKPLPPGLGREWPTRSLEEPRLLIDHTWVDGQGRRHLDHHIFDDVLQLIGQARRLVVVDFFLFNGSGGGAGFRPLARELTEALIARKQAVPDMEILVITDPFNTLYGGVELSYFQQLEGAGIQVVETNLLPLRDSNPLWSTLWRLCCQWLGNNPEGGWLPSPVGGQRVTLRSYLALLNFKANHRKTLVVDHGDTLRGLVTSANPHDGSSRHSNVALAFSGPAALDLLHSELPVALMAGIRPVLPAGLAGAIPAADAGDMASGRILTEGRIRDATLAIIAGAATGDHLDLAAFYLSHRGVIAALIDAHRRGVTVRVLLDANKDAFGLEKDGVPNRPVARDLHRAGIAVRWVNTHGEQFHTKLLVRRDGDGGWHILLGSANFTRRNLDNYNLETNVLVEGRGTSPLIAGVTGHFDDIWHSGPERPPTLSLPYDTYADEGFLKYWRYRLMEATGLSTF